jgi:hypothetical protein
MKKSLLLALAMLSGCTGNTLDVDVDAQTASVAIDVFSGRPNPTFQLSAAEAAALEERLSDLSRSDRDAPDAVLGYRGFIVAQGETRLHVGKGVVVYERGAGREVYEDRHNAEAYLIQIAKQRGYGNVIGR